MDSIVRAARVGILERGELTRGREDSTVRVEVLTGQAWATVVLVSRTGPAAPPDGLVEPSIALRQALTGPREVLTGVRQTLAGPAAAREQALLGRRRVMPLPLAVATRAAAITRAAAVTRMAAGIGALATGIVAVTRGTAVIELRWLRSITPESGRNVFGAALKVLGQCASSVMRRRKRTWMRLIRCCATSPS